MDHRATDDIAPNFFEPSGTERLLVWATRKYAFRCATALLVDLEFRRVCGERLGLAVSTAFQEFLRLLAGYGRRPLALGPPGWRGMTQDEHRLLQLFAAAQAEDQDDRLRMHLAWLLPAPAAREARPRVTLVAVALRNHGRRLSLAPNGTAPITRHNHTP